eukprot:CAMPEP_0204120094 /NCGR_PEP_ID=MMETSP0361-20130328/7465_1 /ASSEMBLY_ACC=CAM_ASM_000343 /TAXON_ID=268821 /ORGANISM="Scrippsiella Hangoei, Strain SHTV-5" /LENGTH=64 /DNA_ID=CAMNT_0051071285 /DNA_START=682 /DNA_END=873 /DNA_ORIENTATION=+
MGSACKRRLRRTASGDRATALRAHNVPALVAAALAVRALPPVGRASEAGFGLSHRHRQREPGDA